LKKYLENLINEYQPAFFEIFLKTAINHLLKYVYIKLREGNWFVNRTIKANIERSKRCSKKPC